MILIIILLSVLLLAVLLRYLLIRRELRTLDQQLRFTLDFESQADLGLEFTDKHLRALRTTFHAILSRQDEERKKRQQSEQQLKELLAFLAHDLRTPLTSIQGYFDLLKNTDDPERRTHFEARIAGSLIQLRHLLDEFFLLSKLHTPNMNLALEPISLQAVVSEVILTFHPEFIAEGIEPQITLPEDDPLVIRGEEEALKRTLQNLLRNALQHGAGGIEIQAGRKLEHIYFKISNSLKPDDEIQAERLFEAGYRADPVRKARESSGLGLAIAEGLLQQMNIKIEAELHDGHIAFYITALPYNPKNKIASPK